MKLDALETRVVSLELRVQAVHARATRTSTENVFVRARTESGVVGVGEAIARSYVTGESTASVVEALAGWAHRLEGAGGDRTEWLGRLDDLDHEAQAKGASAAFAGLEVALLDALAQEEGVSVGALLGVGLPTVLVPTFVVLTSSLRRTEHIARFAADVGARRIKLKVGLDSDRERVAIVRQNAHDAEIWADANGAWTLSEAIERARALRSSGVSVLEQPLAPDVPGELARVERESGLRVSADESIATRRDALRLLEAGSPSVWNLRVAKCGGIRPTIALAKVASANGIGVQIGALVGESSILGAAALWVAGSLERAPLSFEACQGPRILRRDPATPQLVTNGARLPPLRPIGLGVRLEP